MFDGQAARQARIDRGLSREQVAAQAAISMSSMYAYEAGRQEPLFSVAMRLARVLGLEPEALLAEEPAANGAAR